MKKIALLLVLLMGMGTIMASCSTPKVTSTPGSSTSSSTAPTKDTLNLCINAPLVTIDPHYSTSNESDYVLYNVYEGLYHQNENTGEYEPRVAESFTLNDKGDYTFALRKNVKFQNGDTVKASDVVFSLKRCMESPSYRGYTSGISDVVAVDENTVKVVVKAKTAAMLNNLCYLMIVSENVVTEQGKAFGTKIALAGTGPYYFTSLDSDKKWSLEAFADYYRGEASIKTINYRPITDLSAALIAFESGELDWIRNIPTTNWPAIEANAAFNKEMIPNNRVDYIAANPLGKNLGDVRIRKAVAYAMNKQNVIDGVIDGYGVVADFIIPPKINAGAPDTGLVYSYDPAKAKALLAEAGHPNGIDVGSILTIAGTSYEKVAQILQQDFAAVGITVKIERLEYAAVIERLMALNFDIATTGFQVTGDYNYIRNYMFPPAFDASGTTTHEKFSAHFDLADQELDPVKRKKLNEGVNNELMEMAGFLPIFYSKSNFAWAKNLTVVNYPTFPQIYDWHWN